MKKIPLTQGKFALVDDADFDWLNQWKWCAIKGRSTFYAARRATYERGKQKGILMHRVLLGAPVGLDVDHKNGDGLNNQRDNVRVGTPQQNSFNRRRNAKGSSKFKGVCWYPPGRKWAARIRVNQHRFHLGYFSDETLAALAYDAAAKENFGDFARLNFP